MLVIYTADTPQGATVRAFTDKQRRDEFIKVTLAFYRRELHPGEWHVDERGPLSDETWEQVVPLHMRGDVQHAS